MQKLSKVTMKQIIYKKKKIKLSVAMAKKMNYSSNAYLIFSNNYKKTIIS